ncbi:MAG: glycerol-phosphatase [Thermoleophilaceae bacterium]|nr:glycerol-phosphatase [Thermoleophilaceae bacterium]
MPLSPFVAAYDQLILDLDGCVYIGPDPTDRAVEAIAELRSAGKRITFVTNDPRSSGEDYVRRLWTLGIQASLDDVVTVGGAMQHLLAETRQGRNAYVIGTQAMVDHVEAAGLAVMNGSDLAPKADVVVVAGTSDLVFDDLRIATLALRRGADFLVTSLDPTYPMPDGLWPGTGAIVKALEYASGRTPAVVGKPEPQLYLTALDRMGNGRTLAVGDKIEADVAAAKRVGLDAVLVLSGGTTQEEADAAKDPRPDRVADSLGALVLDTA